MRGKTNQTKNIGLASLGAMLEYYDFVVYAFVASLLSQSFFPHDANSWLNEIQIFSIYAVGYFVRPVAGMVIAHFADRIGRKRLFVFTVILMSVPTFLMGLLPTYEQIGVMAPILLLVLRVLQGCAVGGELPSAAVFVCEHTPPKRLYLAGGILQGSVNAGLLLGAGSVGLAGMIASLDPGLASLAWRLPFIAGGVCGLWAAYLRRHLAESPLFEQLREQRQHRLRIPLGIVLRDYLGPCLFGMGMLFVQAVIVVTYFIYGPSYLITQFEVPPTTASAATSLGVLALVSSMVFWGWLADAVGRGKTMGIGAVLSAITAVWFFSAIPQVVASGAGLAGLLVAVGIAGGCVPGLVPGLIASLFPTAVRQSGYALPYNVGAAAFAGPLPLVLSWLIREYGVLSPMYMILAASIVSAVLAVLAHRVPAFLGVEGRSEGDDRATNPGHKPQLSLNAGLRNG